MDRLHVLIVLVLFTVLINASYGEQNKMLPSDTSGERRGTTDVHAFPRSDQERRGTIDVHVFPRSDQEWRGTTDVQALPCSNQESKKKMGLVRPKKGEVPMSYVG